MANKKHNVTALFAGIGGLERGLSDTGHRASLFCEIDRQAQGVLRRRFENTPIVPDVRNSDELLHAIDPKSDLLTAGFPCTDLSQAGLTRGFAGPQSSLILDVLRLLKRRPFPNVLIENVPNWRVLHGGTYFRDVLDRLRALGYRWAYRTVDALAFGLPQRRQRVFLFATLDGDPREALFHGNVTPAARSYGVDEAAHGFYWTEGNRGLGWGEDCVPTLKGGSTVGIPSAPAILFTDGRLGTPHIADAERMQGFVAGWTDLGEAVDQVLGRVFNPKRRWMLVGNAVNVTVASWIGTRLADRKKVDMEDGEVIPPDVVMPPSAWFDGRTRRIANLTAYPVDSRRRSLEGFLEFPSSPLSLRAAEGFLKRASQSRLRFVPGFMAAVSAYVESAKGSGRSLRLLQPIAGVA